MNGRFSGSGANGNGTATVTDGQINLTIHGRDLMARYFGTSERVWLNLQTGYDLDIERDRLGDRLEAEVLQRPG